jgi:hypothetical protein
MNVYFILLHVKLISKIGRAFLTTINVHKSILIRSCILSVLRNTTQVIVRHRICLQTDGHGETSIPPYNFVVGGITTFIERERLLVCKDHSITQSQVRLKEHCIYYHIICRKIRLMYLLICNVLIYRFNKLTTILSNAMILAYNRQYATSNEY